MNNEIKNLTKAEKNWVIYCHTNIINGKKYIGQTLYTENPNQRWRNGNGYKPLKGSKVESVFWKAIQKYGWENFTHEILEENILTQKSADEREKYWIKLYNTYVAQPNSWGYNMTAGGDSGTRLPLSAEHKKKISTAHTGKKLPQEQKDKIRKTLQTTARHYTSEERIQLSLKSKCKKAIRCIELNRIFTGLWDAERATGIKAPGICHALKDRTKSAGKAPDGTKLHWEYINVN